MRRKPFRMCKQSVNARVIAKQLEKLGCKLVGYRGFGLGIKSDGYMYLTTDKRQYEDAIKVLVNGSKKKQGCVYISRDDLEFSITLVDRLPNDKELLEPLLYNRKDKWFNKRGNYRGEFKDVYEKVHRELINS